MTKSDFKRRLLLASVAFRDADKAATAEDYAAALANTGILAGRCAKLAGLPTNRNHWDLSGKCPVVHAVMVIAYFRNEQCAPAVVEDAWRAVQAATPPQAGNTAVPLPAAFLQALGVLAAAETSAYAAAAGR